MNLYKVVVYDKNENKLDQFNVWHYDINSAKQYVMKHYRENNITGVKIVRIYQIQADQ